MTRDTLTTYLQDRHSLGPADTGDDTGLFSEGLLDSMAIVELVVFIEATANIRLEPEEISLDNLDSTARILRFVAEKQAAS